MGRLLSHVMLALFVAIVAAGCSRGASNIQSGFLGGIYLSQAQSEIGVSSNTVVSGRTVTATLTTKDQNGATFVSPTPLTVAFTISGGTSVGTFAPTIDNGDGTYSATFTATVAGSATSLHATVDGKEVSGAQPSITIHSGAYSPANSLITLSSSTTASGSSVVATLRLRDNSNNPLAAGGFIVTFTALGGTSTLNFGATIDNLDGTYTSNVTGVLAGSATAIHASVGATAISSAAPSLTITHGPATQLVFTTQPSGATAGSAFTVQPTVEIRDAAGNRVTTGTDATATLALTLTTGTGSLTGTTSQTAAAGVATWTNIQIDANGSKVITATKPNLIGTGGTASLSQASTSFTNAANPPPVPTGFAAITSDSSVAVSWTASAGAVSYAVLRGATAGAMTSIGTTTSTTYTDATAANGSIYYYAVQAIAAGGTSAATAALQVSMIANFTMTTVTPYIAYDAVAWNSATNATVYDILYDTTPHASSGSYASSVTGVASGASVTGLTAGTTYYFRVRARTAQGSLLSTNELSGAVYQSLALDIPFTSGTDPSYVLVNANRIDLTSAGVARLTPAKQTDDASSTGATSGGFRDGTLTGVQWDSTLGALRLNSTTNLSELDATWTPQWTNLTGYWKFNEASWNGSANEVLDSSGKGRHGARTGSASISTSGRFGSAGSFSASTDSVTIPAASTFVAASNAPITISAWIFPTTISTSGTSIDNRVMSIPNLAGTGSTLVLGVGSTNKVMYFNAGDGTFTTSTATVSANQWSHVALIYTGTCFQIVINGIPDGACAVKSLGIGGPNAVRIGSYNAASSPWAGRLDEVAMWSVALSKTEVQQIYARQSAKYTGMFTSHIMDAYTAQSWKTLSALTTLPFGKELPSKTASETSSATTGYTQLVGSTGSTADNNLTSNLVGYWKLNETSGTFADSSGNANTATAFGGVLNNDCTTATLPLPCRGLPATFGSGVVFTGTTTTGDYVNIPNSTLLQDVQEADSTYSVWFKPTITGTAGTVFGKAGYNMGFLHQANGSVLFQIFNSAYAYISTSASPILTPGQWHHLAAVLNVSGKTLTLYVDGVGISPTNLGTTFATYEHGTMPFRIGSAQPCSPGAASYCNPISGAVDEVAIWNRVLDAGEVKQLFRRGGNRIKYQVRTCSSATCATENATSTQGWVGPNNSNLSYFSELYNTTSNVLGAAATVAAPTMTFANFGTLSLASPQWFQYRAILESDDANTTVCSYGSCSPELRSVAIGPDHYDTTVQTITSKASIGKTFVSLDPSGFTTTGENCTSGARYAISSNGTTFYYWNTSTSTWTAATAEAYAQASPSNDVKNHIDTFGATASTGILQVKTFLKSTGESSCEIDNVRLDGKKY